MIKIRVEDGLKYLMRNQEFRRRVIRAYEVQVKQNHGWGFTVRFQGYRIRFDMVNDLTLPKGLVVYEGYAQEKPVGLQKTLISFMN